jgi:predicted transcriptional regulator
VINLNFALCRISVNQSKRFLVNFEGENFIMGTEVLKLELIEWLAKLEDSAMISQLKLLKDSADNDWWLDLTNEQKSGIFRGLKEADEGRVTPHDEVKRKYGL